MATFFAFCIGAVIGLVLGVFLAAIIYVGTKK